MPVAEYRKLLARRSEPEPERAKSEEQTK